MPPSLEHCFTMRGYFEQESMVQMKAIKGGPERSFIPISSGFIKGKGLDAELIPGGGDVPLLNTEKNTAHLDVRLNFRMKNGHGLFVHYTGVLQVDELSAGPLSFASDAKSTEYGDHEWFASQIFETSDPEFKWLESAWFLGEGRWVVEEGKYAIEYEIYRARPSR